MGNRAETLFGRLERLIPPPDASGWHFTRLNLEAAAMGADDFTVSTQDQQAAIAEDQLRLGAMLVRTDAAPTTWNTDDAVAWKLDPVLDPGASGFFLDVWGRTLSVPRLQGELDATYAKRIISSVSRSTTTNTGLAKAIDIALGTSGTRVVDASQVLQILQFNGGHRMNSGKRFNNAGQATSLWCCFIVQTASAISDADYAKFAAFVDSRKAAGTRMLGIMTGSALAPMISAPGVVPKSSTFTASAVLAAPGVTAFHWTVTGGTIQSGAGTASITVLAGSGEAITLSVSATQDGVETPTNSRDVLLVDSGITPVVSMAYAGDGPFTAMAPNGFGYAWTMSGGYILGASNKRTVTFSMGEANQIATLSCQLTNGSTITQQIKAIPYTSSVSVDTAALATNGHQDFDLDLGWAYDLVSVASDRPAWVRIYNTASDRAADAGRAPEVDPGASTKIVWEGFFVAPDVLTIPDDPQVSGLNGDTPRSRMAYISVVNRDTITAPVHLTITRTETRTSGTF